jgi:hypothetical protein
MFVTVPRVVREIPETDLHWLAGLLEGEGSFVRGPPSAPRTPGLAVSMVDRDVIERAARLLDCAVNLLPARREEWSDAYVARVRGPRAVEWMQRLRPLMGERRRRQIDRAVASYAPDPTRRLNDALAAEALEHLARGQSVQEVAERFGTSIWCMYDLRSGRSHKHVPRPNGV